MVGRRCKWQLGHVERQKRLVLGRRWGGLGWGCRTHLRLFVALQLMWPCAGAPRSEVSPLLAALSAGQGHG